MMSDEELANETPEERRARYASIGHGAGTSTTRQRDRRFVPPRPSQLGAGESGKVVDRRPGGFEMPVFKPDTRDPITLHDYSANRSGYDAQRKALKSGADVFGRDKAQGAT